LLVASKAWSDQGPLKVPLSPDVVVSRPWRNSGSRILLVGTAGPGGVAPFSMAVVQSAVAWAFVKTGPVTANELL
jgi:hypothetical protein